MRERLSALGAAVLVVALAAAGVIVSVGAFARQPAPAGHATPAAAAAAPVTTTTMVAPDGVLDIATVPEAVAKEFHYAADHLDAFRQLRCWCGCEKAFGHRSLADCFVRGDGRWEAHGAGCAVCVGEAVVAHERLDAGTPVIDIAAELDRTFGPPDFTKD